MYEADTRWLLSPFEAGLSNRSLADCVASHGRGDVEETRCGLFVARVVG